MTSSKLEECVAEPPFVIDLVLPYVSSEVALRISACSRGSLRLLHASADWQRRALVDFGVNINIPSRTHKGTTCIQHWEKYLELVHARLKVAESSTKASAWRDFCTVRLLLHAAQVFMLAWGAFIPAALSGLHLHIVPSWVAVAFVACGPLLPLASTVVVGIAAVAEPWMHGRLSARRLGQASELRK